MNDEEEANVKECGHCSGDGFEPMTGKWRESHACRVCGGDGEVASSIEGTSSPQPIEGVHDLPSYDAAPPRPEGSNIARHAWDELNRAGAFTAEGDFYGGMTGRAVMDLVDVFVEQGHSGASASIVIDLLRRVLAFEPLGPLTDDPDEWMEVDDGLWQSRRQPRAFSKDGGKTYRLNGDRDTLHTAEVSGRGCTEECNQEEHEHRHQWQGEDYVCECGDVLARGLWR